jgi:hypothetical protein
MVIWGNVRRKGKWQALGAAVGNLYIVVIFVI